MPRLDADLATAIERLEARAWTTAHLALPQTVRERLGVAVVRYDGSFALRVPAVDHAALNRVIGLGLERPLRRETLDTIIDDFTAAGSPRLCVHFSDMARPAEVVDWLEQKGFRRGLRNAKLLRSAADSPAVIAPNDVRVEQIDDSRADVFVDTVATPLGAPDPVRGAPASTIGHAGWRHYLAYVGDRAIAGAALFCEADTAWCGFGATREDARRQGAQTALLARRIVDARKDGCRWITAETLAERPGDHNPSLHNMQRLGFAIAYERDNYVLEIPKQ